MQKPRQIATWNSEKDFWENGEDIFGHSDVYSETWPVSGMTVNGVAYELPMWEPATDDSVYSSWQSDVPDSSLLRTPTTGEGRKATMGTSAAERKAGGHQPYLTHQIADLVLLKTPTSQLAVNGGSQHPDKRKAGGHGPTLADEVEHLLPTPTSAKAGSDMGLMCSGDGRDKPNKLGWAIALLPTPVAQPSGNTPQDHLRKKPGRVVVTDLAIIVENGLLETGGQLPSNGDHTPRLFADGKPCEEPPLPLPN